MGIIVGSSEQPDQEVRETIALDSSPLAAKAADAAPYIGWVPAAPFTDQAERCMTMPRREAIAACALLAEYLASAGSLGAQTPGNEAQQAGPVFKQDLPDLTMDGWEVTASHVDYAPGRVGAPHRHPGFVLVYVLSGEVIAKVSGQGEEKRYSAGQMFYEQPGATHEVSKNASATEPARILAMIFAKKGSTLTVPVGGTGDAVL